MTCPPRRHVVKQRAGHGPPRARRKDRFDRGAGRRDHPRRAVVGQDDRRPVERDHAPQLANERGERLLDLERRPERPCAAIRGVEEIDPPAELVAEPFRFRRALVSDGRLLREPVHEPPDDRADGELEPERDRDGLEPEVGRREVVASPPLDSDEHRDLRDR